MGFDVDLAAAVDPMGTSDAGIPEGAALLAFATSAQSETRDLGSTREALQHALGQSGVVEAAATVAAFNGLVRVADGTGIQLDAGLEIASAVARRDLGLDDFAGAANTPSRGEAATETPVPVEELFG